MTFSPARHRYRRLGLLPVLLMMMACGESNRTPAGPSPADGIQDSAALFQLITQTDPLTAYTLFPNVEEFTVGRLNGSEAHRPIVRVSINARALGALQSGRLPTAAQFPAGSIILKEIRPRADAPATLYAVMYKDVGNTLAGNGWLWAEFSPDGSVGYSVSNRGTACTSCHQREQGPLNDLVRTFERSVNSHRTQDLVRHIGTPIVSADVARGPGFARAPRSTDWRSSLQPHQGLLPCHLEGCAI
jgi:hypothetical protein